MTTKNEVGATYRSTKKSTTATTSLKRPFDTFFGDNDSGNSDEDENDDDDADEWEDPLLGRLWGPAIGTSANRFAALQPPKKVKTPPNKNNNNSQPKKVVKKPKLPPPRKKQPGEKFPIDHAKEFVEAISPQEGYSTALQFLVWGGIGGTPPGRGVLIPGSVTAFPASSLGIRKSWQRYEPLVEVAGRAWPGFCTALLVHLVDSVLSIEENCVEQGSEDAGSARKLFFLSAWIRLLVSERLAQKLCSEPRTTSSNRGKKSNTTEIPLACYETIEGLQYPLNSLCDRCCFRDQLELRKTSRDILRSFEEILGSRRIVHHGIPVVPPPAFQEEARSIQDLPVVVVRHGPALSDGKMSLDEMEALLSDNDEGDSDAQKDGMDSKGF